MTEFGHRGEPQDGGAAPSGYALPRLMPTRAQSETFGGVTYHIDGELVPALTVDVTKASIFFEHHILLWKNPSVTITLKAMAGAVRRMIAGMQVFVTQAAGPGMIALSRDGPGHIVPIHMPKGTELEVREHQFLAATDAIDYSFKRVKGIANMLFGGTGFFIDKFHSHAGDGILWLHGYGNVFEKVLASGESIDVEPGGWLYKTTSVTMETKVDRITSGAFGANFNLVVNRFTGPGRIGIQSMYVHYVTET
jgi:uncharacterized protein (AIM24 family)